MNGLVAENEFRNCGHNAIGAGQSSTESSMWPIALEGKYEAKGLLIRNNEIHSAGRCKIQFMACIDSTAEFNHISASSYYTDVVLNESSYTHSAGTGWVTRNITLRNNCAMRPKWLTVDPDNGIGFINANNNSTGCHHGNTNIVVTVDSTNLTVKSTARVSQVYQLQCSTNLQTWIDTGNSITASTTTVSLSDPSISKMQRRFYRVKISAF
jgi:hypothetical protein